MARDISIKMMLDTSNYMKEGEKVRIYARDTKKELDSKTKLSMELDIVKLQNKLKQVKESLKDKDISGTKQVKLQLEANSLQRDLTEAKRLLNNYVNTGDSALSRLKMKFDGLGTALSGSFSKVGMFIGTIGITDFLKKTREEAKESARITAQFDSVLKSTNNTVGLTASSLKNMSVELGKKNGLDNDTISSAQNMLLTFTNIRKDAFEPATQAVIDMATAMNGGIIPSNQELEKTAIQVGKALNDPINGVTALRKVGVTLDDQQKKEIKTLMKRGEIEKAQAIILKELSKEFGGSAEAQLKASGSTQGLIVNYKDLQETIGGALTPSVSGFVSVGNKSIDMIKEFISQNPKLSQALVITTAGVVALSSAIAFLGGPVTIAIGLLAAFAVTGMGLVNSYNAMTDAFSKYRDGLIDANGNLTELGKKYKEIQDAALKQKSAIDANNASIAIFNKLKVNQTGTRAEFEATRKKAIEGANANIALAKSMLAVMAASKVNIGEGVKSVGSLGSIGKIGGVGNITDSLKSKYTSMMSDNEKSLKSAIDAVFTGSGNSGGSSSGSGSSLKDKLKKQAQDARDVEIDAVNKSVLTQEEKYKKIADISKKYNDRIKEIEGKTNEDIIKEAEDYEKDKEKLMDEAKKSADDYIDKLDDISEKFEDLKKDALKAIGAINLELSKLDTDQQTSMAERYGEVQSEIWKIKGQDKLSADDHNELNKLEREKEFLIGKTTAAEREQGIQESMMTESEKNYNKYLKERNNLLEKQNILKSFASNKSTFSQNLKVNTDENGNTTGSYVDEKGNTVDIKGVENMAYAQNLVDNQNKLQQEYTDLQDSESEKLKLYQKTSDDIVKVWQAETAAFQKELDARKIAMDTWVISAQGYLATQAQVGALSGSSTAIVNNSTVDNSKTTTIKNIINNASDASMASFVNRLTGAGS